MRRGRWPRRRGPLASVPERRYLPWASPTGNRSRARREGLEGRGHEHREANPGPQRQDDHHVHRLRGEKALDGVEGGEVVEILTDDAAAIVADLKAWARACEHGLLGSAEEAGLRRLLIQKGAPRPASQKLAMVISHPGLEELLFPLGFALAAAMEGIEVHLYVQGPAVKVLKRGFKPRLHRWARPFSGFARRGLARAGHIGPQEKLTQLRQLGGPDLRVRALDGALPGARGGPRLRRPPRRRAPHIHPGDVGIGHPPLRWVEEHRWPAYRRSRGTGGSTHLRRSR